MEPERWRKVERLYHAALEFAPEERAVYLDESCAGDEALRREVESLLVFDDRAEQFIETPPDDVAAGMIAEGQARSMAGRTLGHYRINSLLGAGGMGEVYRARDTRLDREVAIKILPEELAGNPEALRRFEREAKAVAALSHPNILAIHDFGYEQGVSYAVMELLEGETIRARLTRVALPWREAVEVGLAVADGVAAAHAKGIIHRDLKPENIFMTSDGQVKILDFGIARVKRIGDEAETITSSPTKTTEAGLVMGTLGYMSPEQARGETADAPSDIFSLGCVLYEMVSGRRPFVGQTVAETMAAILRDAPPPIAQSRRAAPAELERVVMRCLEKQTSARYQSARDLASDLRALLGGNMVTASLLPQRRLRPAARVVAVILILLLGVAAWLYLAGGRDKGVGSLAILPLVNAGGGSEVEYLSDGITENLINSLSQLPELRVMARSTVFSYKGKEIDPRKVGQELNVSAVFTGRVTQQGAGLVVEVELVSAQDGTRLWGEQYQRKLSDTLTVQTEIARQISEKLRLKLTSDEQKRLTRRHTESPEAYQLYLRGRYFWNNWSGDDLQKGIEYFEKAIALDPGFTLAYVGLADAYYGLSGQHIPSKEAMPRVRAAARKALDIDETIGEAHVSLAFARAFYDWEWEEGKREFKRAIELNPNYAPAHWGYGLILVINGRPDEGLRELQIAQDLDPFSLSIAVTATWPYYYAPPSARQYDRAIANLKKIISANPNFAAAHGFLGYVYAQKGMFEEALAEQNEARKLEDLTYSLSSIGYIYAVSGKITEAQKKLAEVLEVAKSKHLSPVMLARLYAGLGEKDQAFALMYKAWEEKEEELTLLQVDPQFDSLRSDARFTDLLRRINLTP